MTPFSFEWQWNVDYFIFMGLLYLALLVVGCGLVVSYIKTWLDLSQEKEAGSGPAPEIPQRTKYSQY